MALGLLVGYIASGVCFMLVLLSSLVGLPSFYSESGFFATALGILLIAGAFVFPYLLGRGGF